MLLTPAITQRLKQVRVQVPIEGTGLVAPIEEDTKKISLAYLEVP